MCATRVLPVILRICRGRAGKLVPFGLGAVLAGGMPQGVQAQEIGSSAQQYLVTPSWREALETWDTSKLHGASRVVDRTRDDFKPLGLRLPGGHLLMPSLGLMAIHDDNVFRSNGANRKGDLSYELTPSVVFLSQFPRHMLNFEAGGRFAWHQEQSQLDVIDGHGLVNWRVDIDSGNVVGGSVVSRIHHDDDYTAEGPANIAELVQVHENAAEIGYLHDAGRLALQVGADIRTSDYTDVLALDGALIDQDDRDNTIFGTYARLNYRASPGYTTFAAVRFDRQEFWQESSQGRNGNLYKIEMGVDAEFNPLFRWGLSGGYAFNDVDQGSVQDGSGYIVRGRVQWLPTERMTVTLDAAREIGQSTIADAGGSTRNKFQARIDYDVFHNVLLYGEGGYLRHDFFGTAGSEEFVHAGVGIEYFMNRNVSLSAGYEYRQRNNSNDSRDYEDNRFMVGVKLAQ